MPRGEEGSLCLLVLIFSSKELGKVKNLFIELEENQIHQGVHYLCITLYLLQLAYQIRIQKTKLTI